MTRHARDDDALAKAGASPSPDAQVSDAARPVSSDGGSDGADAQFVDEPVSDAARPGLSHGVSGGPGAESAGSAELVESGAFAGTDEFADDAGTDGTGAEDAASATTVSLRAVTPDNEIDWDGILGGEADPLRPRRTGPHPLALVGAALVGAALVLVVGWWGRWLPAPTPAPASDQPVAAASATPSVDPAKVAAFQARIAANPADAAALAGLGDLYSEAGDAASAQTWHAEALAVTPNDPDVLLAYGVDLFNLNDFAGATTQWLRVTELRPSDANAWYNLGWSYMSADPPQPDRADAAWAKVLQLAPDSDMAKTVRGHRPTAAPTPPR